MGRWRRTSSGEKAVWKLIANPGSDGYLIAHFLKEEKFNGGMSLKGMVRRAREKWNMMSHEEQRFLRRVPFFPAFGECLTYQEVRDTREKFEESSVLHIICIVSVFCFVFINFPICYI